MRFLQIIAILVVAIFCCSTNGNGQFKFNLTNPFIQTSSLFAFKQKNNQMTNDSLTKEIEFYYVEQRLDNFDSQNTNRWIMVSLI